MTMNATTYWANQVIDHMLRNQAYTPPTNLYLMLVTTAVPNAAGAGTEVAGGSYTRQVITISAASAGTTATTAQVVFTLPACTVTGAYVCDASASGTGNKLLFSIFATPKTFAAGETLTVTVGAFTLAVQ